MPKEAIPLRTRLEHTVGAMEHEIRSLSIKPWAFVHLAAMTSVQACESNPELARMLNVEGAKKWFQAASATNCKHFVLVSTSHVFAVPPCAQPLTPESPVGPTSVYGQTKLASEMALRALAMQRPNTKLTIARVFSVLSERRRPGFLLTGLHSRARRRDLSPIPGLSYIRDFLEAPEICRRLVTLATTVEAPHMVLICSGRGRPIRDIAAHVFQQYGLDPSLLQEAASKPDDIPYLVGVPSRFS